MGDSFTEVTSQGWGSRLLASIKGVLVGGAFFLGAFPLLVWNESSWNSIASTGIAIMPFSSFPVSPSWTCRPPLRSARMPGTVVAVIPNASTETCAPPAVTSRMASLTLSPACTVATAPSRVARSSFSFDRLTATTRPPNAVAIWMAASPTPPMPNTTTHSPG